MLDNFSFAIPVFHAYGHTADCQVCYICTHTLHIKTDDGLIGFKKSKEHFRIWLE